MAGGTVAIEALVRRMLRFAPLGFALGPAIDRGQLAVMWPAPVGGLVTGLSEKPGFSPEID